LNAKTAPQGVTIDREFTAQPDVKRLSLQSPMLRIEIIQALQERIRDTELIDGSRLSASLRAAFASSR
jgi:hypothetical protein